MTNRMQSEIDEMKKSARTISKPDSALTVKIFKLPNRIKRGISRSLTAGKRSAGDAR